MAPTASSDPGPSQSARNARKTFPRASRLLRHAEFDRVYKQGRRHFSTSMTVFYLQRSEPDQPVTSRSLGPPRAAGFRVGFTVGRALGGAVQRNRMKRRLREAVRLGRPASEPSVDIVINPKKALLTVAFSTLQQELARAFTVVLQKAAAPQSTKLSAEDKS